MLFTLTGLKADALLISLMNSAVDAKLSTPGFMRFVSAVCLQSSQTPEK